MGKWSESEIYQKTRGTSRWTRFVGWLNNLMNPNHDWVSDWNEYDQNTGSSIANAIDSWVDVQTQKDVTGRDVALNEMTMQNQEDQYQRQVVGMQKAGLNPALMYQSGAGSAPSAQPASGGSPMSMSDLMQMMLLPLQKSALEAQVKQTEADTTKTLAETDQIKQLMEWYPRLSESTISEVASRIGLNVANTSKAEVEAEIGAFEKIIKSAEADEASAFYKARREYEQAKTPEAQANAAAALARAAWDTYEKEYTESHGGARPSSSATLALINAISGWLGLHPDSPGFREVVDTVTDDVKHPGNMLRKAAGQAEKLGLDDRSLIRKGKNGLARLGRGYDKFRDWMDKPKYIGRRRSGSR